jgi:protein-disulfide isomerase
VSLLRLSAFAACFALAGLAADAPNGKMVGNQTAPIRLEVFSDFSCPGCKAFHDDLLPVIMREYVTPGKAFIVFRDYVLPPSPGHQFSREAAQYAAAANRVGKYRPVADALFAAQPSWAFSGKVWDAVAPVLTNAEQKRVQELVKQQLVADEVNWDTEAGKRAGLLRTPTVGINFKTQHRLWNQWGADGNKLFLGYLQALLQK